MLQIDDQRLRAAVEQNEAALRVQEIAIERQKLQVENLQTQWERTRGLHERKLIDDDKFEVASKNLDIARVDLQSSRASLAQFAAQLSQAKDHLSKTRVYAPIDGTVTSLDIKVGETAIASSTNIPGSNLMTIANADTMLAEVNVDEADIANIETEQRARVFAIAFPDTAVEGDRLLDRGIREGGRGPPGVELRGEDQVARTRKTSTCAPACHAAPRSSRRRESARSRRRSSRSASTRTSRRRSRSVRVREPRRRREGSKSRSGSRTTRTKRSHGLAPEGDAVITGPDRVLRALEDGDRIAVAGS